MARELLHLSLPAGLPKIGPQPPSPHPLVPPASPGRVRVRRTPLKRLRTHLEGNSWPLLIQVPSTLQSLQSYGSLWWSHGKGDARLNVASVWWLEAGGTQLHGPRLEGRAPGACESAPTLGGSPYPREHDIKEHMKTPHQSRERRGKGIVEPRKTFYIVESWTVYVPCFLNKRPRIFLWKSIPHIL